MSSFDVLVSSSLAEAFPLVIGEAMATSRPCVVTDVGDSAYLVGDTGRVVPSRDPNALASATLDLLSVPSASRRALGEKARARIAKCFDLDLIASRYEALYLEELAGSASR
jgi:glycosyltransferase involved in cell wall biosynthesis